MDPRAVRRRRRLGRPAAVPLLAVAVAAVLLTGCDAKQAGAAAIVGNTRISETQVDKDAVSVVRTLKKIGGTVPDTAALLRAEVEFRVDAQLVDIAAAREGITITQGEIDTLITQSGGRAAVQRQLVAQDALWLPPAELDALAREFLSQQQLQQRLAPGAAAATQQAALNAYIARLARQVGVSISPRYGTWNPSALTVTPGANDLSVPAGGIASSGAVAPTSPGG